MLKKIIPLIFLLALFALGVYAFWIEPRQLVVKELTVSIPHLREPVKAVVIGDLQPLRQYWPKERLQWAIDLAVEQKPDIVFYVGDYVYEPQWAIRFGISDRVTVKPVDVVQAMARIHAPMGVYAVMGNHDYWWNGELVKALIRQTHIRLLVDEGRLVRSGSKVLWVAGIDDLATPRVYHLNQALSKNTPEIPTVLLSHSPDIFPEVPNTVELTLAGHTHGGQVFIPGIGRPIVPIKYKKYAMGLFEEHGKKLFVTSGIGTSILPVRFLTPPEIVVLKLVPARS